MQIPLEEASQKFTVANTHRGLMAATRLVYGISNAPAIFQRMIETLLAEIPHTAIFLDDDDDDDDDDHGVCVCVCVCV